MPDGAVRSGKTGNSEQVLDYQDLLRLARDRSHKSRTALFEAISDLVTSEERTLTAKDRELMQDIIANLIEDVELSVRRKLAERLAEKTGAPRELIVCLANDEIAVARPILLQSTLLRDPELIEIIQHRTMEHQVTVAMRPNVSESVSEALVWTDRPEVIVTLLENQTARISERALSRVAEKSAEREEYRSPLLHRQELPPRLARKLYWTVSAALRDHIIKNFEIDPDSLDDTIEGAIKDTVETEIALSGDQGGEISYAAPGSDDVRTLMRMLEDGRVPEFVQCLARLAGLRPVLVRRILFEPGGQGTAVICKAVGLDKEDFAPIFLRFRQGRLGDKQVEFDELTQALRDFDRIARNDALEVVRRWRRNPEYLNALRMVEDARD